MTEKRLKNVLGLQHGSMPEQPRVSIIILTFNALEFTRKCVESIQRHTVLPHEIIFVDNGSTDGSGDYLKGLAERHPNYRVIENGENRGYAAGNNQGMEIAAGEYVLLLNNDVMVSPHWLERLVACAEMDPAIGLVGPLTNLISGFQKVENFRYENSDDYLQVADKIASINAGRYTPRRRIAGFAMLIKRALYDHIGGLDEQFGSGNYEDDDYCLRAKGAGFKIMAAEGVFIHHFGSKSFEHNKIDYRQAISRNRRLFEKKWPGVAHEWLLEISGRLTDENESLSAQGQIELEDGDIQKAMILYEQVLDSNPVDTTALYGLGLAHQLQDNKQEARKYFSRVVELVPEFCAVYTSLGLLSAHEGDYEGAVAYFGKVLELEPDDLDARRNVSELLIEMERYDEGILMLQSILAENPRDIATLNQLGALCMEAGKLDEAKSFFDQTLVYEPGNEQAQEYINNIGSGQVGAPR